MCSTSHATSKNDPVTLYVYTRTDNDHSDSADKIHVTFRKAVPLGGVVGGGNSKCFMAGGDAFLYAGTDASTQADAVDTKALTVRTVGGTGGTLTSIIAEERGYICRQLPGRRGLHIQSFRQPGPGEHQRIRRFLARCLGAITHDGEAAG